MNIPIEVSAKHIHLSEADVQELFGEGYELTPLKELSQPGAFAAKEKVELVAENGDTCSLRAVGPARENTQVEIAFTDAFKIGFEPPVRESGNIENSASALLKGSQGEKELKEGVIIAKRHIHVSPDKAEAMGVEDGQEVSVKTEGERGVTFHNTVVRVHEKYDLSMHIDTDEGNAAGIPKGGTGKLII